MPASEWAPPPLGQGDYLVETEIVEADGTRSPIVVAVLLHGDGTRTVTGYSRSIDLAPGASLVFPVGFEP